MLDIEIKVMKYFAHEELPMDETQQKWLMVPPQWLSRKGNHGLGFKMVAKSHSFHHNWRK